MGRVTLCSKYYSVGTVDTTVDGKIVVDALG